MDASGLINVESAVALFNVTEGEAEPKKEALAGTVTNSGGASAGGK